MLGNENYSLESIIKVEPEEFQQETVDDVLRSRANIFSDPIVLLERLNIETTAHGTSNLDQRQEKIGHRDTVKTFARKGNEGVHCIDPHTCCFCLKIFSNRANLRTHLKKVHCRTKKLSCDLCPKIFFSNETIRRHMKTVHGKKKFACNVCDYKTSHKMNLVNHELTHAAKVECPICKKMVSALKSHMRTHRPKETCPTCQKLITPSGVKRHMKTHGQKCENCGAVFENKGDLRRHNLRKHYDGKLQECHCGALFTLKSLLQKHQQSHNEKITCKVCQKQFRMKGNFKVHWTRMHLKTHGLLGDDRMRVLNHNGPFICDKCGSKHKSRQSFQNHIHSSHPRATKFCDLCPRSFAQKCHLTKHMKNTHLKLRPFECKICGYTSFFKSNLKIHMQQHGSKTECKVCHKLVANMSYHLRSHVKVKCPTCNKTVKKYSLSKHVKTQHEKKAAKRRNQVFRKVN